MTLCRLTTPPSYFEHVEGQKKPAVAFDLIDFHDDEETDGIKVVEHTIPPPQLARLIAETRLPEDL